MQKNFVCFVEGPGGGGVGWGGWVGVKAYLLRNAPFAPLTKMKSSAYLEK
ncbi:hypothetical protein OROMI_005983 [Orobanche minor]